MKNKTWLFISRCCFFEFFLFFVIFACLLLFVERASRRKAVDAEKYGFGSKSRHLGTVLNVFLFYKFFF